MKGNPYVIAVILCLTLGLAPFFPEPHLFKQWLRFRAGTFGEPADWMDVLMHGAPFAYLAFLAARDGLRRLRGSAGRSSA